MFTRFQRIAACLCLAAAVSGGCSDSSTDAPGSGVDATVRPKMGASFTYSVKVLDADSVPSTFTATEVDRLTDTASALDGRTAAYQFDRPTYDFIYDYQSDGNVAVNARKNILDPLFLNAVTYPLASAWFVLPVTGASSRLDTLVSTQNWSNGSIGGLPLLIRAESNRTGTTTVTLDSLKFNAVNLTTTLEVREASQLYRVYITWTYVPKLGYFAVHNQYLGEGLFTGGVRAGGYLRTLKGYKP